MDRIMNMASRLLLFVIIAFSISNMNCNSQRNGTHIYGTWDNMEIDKCASAWLIKRHADTLATFVFFPVGEIITGAIPFDTPDSELSRTNKLSAFQNIMRKYSLEDGALMAIGDIIQELEINSWETVNTQKSESALRIDSMIRSIIQQHDIPEHCFQSCFPIFDSVYNEFMRTERKRQNSR